MQTLIKKIVAETHYRKNPYFVSLNDGTFEKEDFVETQFQFFFAVVFFSQPMAALAARIPSAELRREILRNVWEENGEGDTSKVHAVTFRAFLKQLANISPGEIEKRALWPEVRAFNTVLTGACVLDEYLVSAGMMGMIENMFSDISGIIGQGVVKRGWSTTENLVHYKLHKELDVKHSQDFFDVLQPSWDAHAENHYFIEQGLRLGATVFNSLYEGLYAQRKRRLFRNVIGPHTRAYGG